MIKSLIIGIGGIVSLLLMWVLIQYLWRKEFSEHLSDEDVLAGRRSCANCGCTSICKRTDHSI